MDEDLYLETFDVPFTFFALFKWIKEAMQYDGVFPSNVSLDVLLNHSLSKPQDKYSCYTTNWENTFSQMEVFLQEAGSCQKIQSK